MRLPQIRVRTLMGGVMVVALGLMGARSFVYYRLATKYAEQEHGWREIAARDRSQRPWGNPRFEWDCAEYFQGLTQKYRRAMWQPWRPVAPDTNAPGVKEARAVLAREAAKAKSDEAVKNREGEK